MSMAHPEALAIYAFARLRQIDSGEWSIARLTLISPYQLVYYDIPYQSGIIRTQIILYQQLALMMGISKLSTMLAFRLGRAFI